MLNHCLSEAYIMCYVAFIDSSSLPVSYFQGHTDFPSNLSSTLGRANGWWRINLQPLFRMFVLLKLHFDKWTCLCVSHKSRVEGEIYTMQSCTKTNIFLSSKGLIKDYVSAISCISFKTDSHWHGTVAVNFWHNTLQMFTPKSWLKIGFA